MPEQGNILQRLLLICGLLIGTSCRYSGPCVESHEDVTLTYSADASTSVYAAQGRLGEYRRKRFEGQARAVLAGGQNWGLRAGSEESSQPIAQPFSAPRLVLEPFEGGRVRMQHGKGRTSTLKFVTGTWSDYAAGRDVVLRFEAASWQAWLQASQEAMLLILDRYRSRVIPQLDSQQELSDARVVDVLIDEQPLVRANRGELMVFFEALRLEAGFAITTRRRNPRRSWWSYELRPGVSDVFAFVAQATVYVGIASLECCGHIVRHGR